MKTYKIIATSMTYYTLEIQAENEDEAWGIAQEADGGDFREIDQGDWEIYSVAEVQK